MLLVFFVLVHVRAEVLFVASFMTMLLLTILLMNIIDETLFAMLVDGAPPCDPPCGSPCQDAPHGVFIPGGTWYPSHQ